MHHSAKATIMALAGGLSIGLTGAVSAACKSAEPPRLEVRMFKYGGVKGDSAERKFSLFHSIIIEKIRHFQQKAQFAEVDVKHLEKLTIVPGTDNIADFADAPTSFKDLQNTWEAYKNYLVLLTGKLDEVKSKQYYAFSQVYWGTLRPVSLHEEITAKLPIAADSGGKTMDSHSLLTLFTLAMDARRRECHSSTILYLLQEALYHANDLERRDKLEGDLAQVKKFIEKLIASYVS